MPFALVMIFGMFAMQVKHARFMTGYTIVLAGAVMVWRSHTDSQNYPATYEGIHFALMAVVLVSITKLSVLLSNMRRRLKNQKTELEQALAHIQENGNP